MPRFRNIKNSFLGGQISRTAVGRTDLPQYPHSCEILQNMIPMLSGGAYRRPGTVAQDVYLGGADAGYNDPPRLLPFIVSANESYAIALGYGGLGSSGYVDAFRAVSGGTFYTQGVVTGTTPYLPATQSSFAATGIEDSDITLVQTAHSNSVMWLVHPNHKPQTLTRTAKDTFTVGDFDAGLSGLQLSQAYPYLNQNATDSTMAISSTSKGTGRTLTCSNPYFNPGHIGAIFALQSGTDNSSGAAIGFVQVTAMPTFGKDGVNAPSTTNPAATCTATVLTTCFDTSAHTTWWESAWSNYRGWPSTVCVFQQRLCMAGALDTVNPLTGQVPALSASTLVNAYPVSGATSLWFTETGNYFKFSALEDSTTGGLTVNLANGQVQKTPVAPSDFVHYPIDDSQGDGASTGPLGIQPFRITLSDNEQDTIQWVSPDQEILVGTLSKEYIVAPQNGTFDVANSIATIQSHYGSDYVPAVRIGYELVFALRSKDEVRAYQYNYIDASFFGEPVQLFFDEYPKPELGTFLTGRRKFRQMEWDVTRNTLWCLDTAGNFFGMTRDRKLQVTMWHTHQFGGYNPAQGVALNIGSGGSTRVDPAWYMCDGSVVSFASVPNPVSGINDIWLSIKRTIQGRVTWSVERMIGKNTVRDSAYQAVFPSPAGCGTEPVYVDSAAVLTDNGDGSLVYDMTFYYGLTGYKLVGTYYSSMWGLFVIATTGPVSDNAVTLATPLPPDYGGLSPPHAFTLGLPYTSIIQPVRVEVNSPIGTSQGAVKRISKAYIRFFKTLLGKAGSNPGNTTNPFGNLATIPWAPGASMGQSPEIYTGDKQVFIPSQYDRDGYLYIVQDQPLPFTLVSVVSEGEEYEQ